MPKDTAQTARLYRMVMPDHLCPYGLKSKDLLERKGFEVDDHHLTTREETDAFMEEHGVETTPQTWIGDERIGGGKLAGLDGQAAFHLIMAPPAKFGADQIVGA